MSLRKSPALTPALLAACRRNARRSTGPRTARGKAQVRMNALRGGGRSQVLEAFIDALLDAPLGGVKSVAQQFLTADLARQRTFLEWAEIAIQADLPDRERARWIRALGRTTKKDSLIFFDQSGNLIENKGPLKTNKGPIL